MTIMQRKKNEINNTRNICKKYNKTYNNNTNKIIIIIFIIEIMARITIV